VPIPTGKIRQRIWDFLIGVGICAVPTSGHRASSNAHLKSLCRDKWERVSMSMECIHTFHWNYSVLLDNSLTCARLISLSVCQGPSTRDARVLAQYLGYRLLHRSRQGVGRISIANSAFTVQIVQWSNTKALNQSIGSSLANFGSMEITLYPEKTDAESLVSRCHPPCSEAKRSVGQRDRVGP
jgi:hypothetical protein